VVVCLQRAGARASSISSLSHVYLFYIAIPMKGMWLLTIGCGFSLLSLGRLSLLDYMEPHPRHPQPPLAALLVPQESASFCLRNGESNKADQSVRTSYSSTNTARYLADNSRSMYEFVTTTADLNNGER
jgi:hypothetical protein